MAKERITKKKAMKARATKKDTTLTDILEEMQNIRSAIAPFTRVMPSQPPKPQDSSPLFRLPAELHHLILRAMLKSDQPFSKRQAYNKSSAPMLRSPTSNSDVLLPPKQASRGYGLVPAILETCQKLFVEGLPILYDNILEVRVGGTNPEDDPDVTPPRSMLTFDDCFLAGERNRYASHRREVEVVLARFPRLQLTIGSIGTSPGAISDLLEMLVETGPIFRNKYIDTKINLYHSYRSTFRKRLMRSFLLIRCAGFRFTGIHDPFALKIAVEVEGPTEAIDLWAWSSNLLAMIDVLGQKADGDDATDIQRSLQGFLSVYRDSHNVASFLYHRDMIMRTWRSVKMPVNAGFEDPDLTEYYLHYMPHANASDARWKREGSEWLQYTTNCWDPDNDEWEVEEDGATVNACIRRMIPLYYSGESEEEDDSSSEEDSEED